MTKVNPETSFEAPQTEMSAMTHDQLIDRANQTQSISERVIGRALMAIDGLRRIVLGEDKRW